MRSGFHWDGHSEACKIKQLYSQFKTKYNISSEKFINEWSAEDLKGKDLEYVEWAGEYQLFSRLNERLVVLESIENVTL